MFQIFKTQARQPTSAAPNNALTEQYSEMQRRVYNSLAGKGTAEAKAAVHPNYEEAQAQAKYQLAYILREYSDRQGVCRGKNVDEILASLNRGPKRPKLLDFGCGVGRLMEAGVDSGYEVDGVDLSAEMLKIAGQSPSLTKGGSRFFLTTGQNCGDAPKEHYDIVYSFLCFQHICVRTIRKAILKAMHASLAKNGMVYIQTQFYPQVQGHEVPHPHSSWDKANTTANATNSGADAWVTPDQLGEVYQDFARLFSDIRIQFITTPGLTNGKWNAEHVAISGSKSPSLSSRHHCSL